ncbi:c-type cytochrome [Methylomarinum sp. Ch1-1]|uniref:C-type cytochrome n=1 Tax=Methylomarinum roseum TaxID=3067653 RepID=A0AAU7NVV4_9GAMM|nr:c-type cytochrome [Methylomarinum sp. Ch1-1]MDP4522827.1 c-type cytochrome [Methylomarinum sp. Ch1-1]
MIKKLLTVSISLALTGISAVVHAEGNAQEGKTQAASCAGCHGEDGNSMAPTFPKLAGQHESYLIKQLLAFKAGARNAPMMAPLAMGLNEKAIENIAAYYSEQSISANQPPVLETDDDEDENELDQAEQEAAAEKRQSELDELMALGSDLYRNGDLEREVSACIACHGPYGEGNKPAVFPALRSQHADYLIKSLSDYKKGERQNNPDNMMHMIAKKMTDKQIKAVSYHISMMK